jgi:hypothetical protein
MAKYKVGERVLTRNEPKPLSVEEILSKVKTGSLTTWREATISGREMKYIQGRRKNRYTIKFDDGIEHTAFPREIAKIKKVNK